MVKLLLPSSGWAPPAPRLRPAGGALADLREGLHAVQAPSEKPASCPAHPEKSLWECLRECRREQPPMSRPTTPLSQTKSRLADFREGLRAVPAVHHPWPGTPGKQPPGVPCTVANGHYPPIARHTRKRASGSGYSDADCSVASRSINPPTPRKEPRGVGARMPFAQKDNSQLAVACHPFTWTKSRQGERVTIHTRNRPG